MLAPVGMGCMGGGMGGMGTVGMYSMQPGEKPWNSFINGYEAWCTNVSHNYLTGSVELSYLKKLAPLEEALHNLIPNGFYMWYPLGKFALILVEVEDGSLDDLPEKFAAAKEAKASPSDDAEYRILPMGVKKSFPRPAWKLQTLSQSLWSLVRPISNGSKGKGKSKEAGPISNGSKGKGKSKEAGSMENGYGKGRGKAALRLTMPHALAVSQSLLVLFLRAEELIARLGDKGKGKKARFSQGVPGVPLMQMPPPPPMPVYTAPPPPAMQPGSEEMQRQMYGEQLYVLVLAS
ncbi:hypothetical protein AK812_SmicGene3489 [Symbiodinium microadriaticum]|uniref:Uncharacterized protein n=1 Tax=Symbiodinium microadriaticum TaxID=2951 RepID=A0A1Q9EYQ7_SYMMI|nr:hypothetical protein AK812_SmicGene3489 [Symbiodinium microadriaticum]